MSESKVPTVLVTVSVSEQALSEKGSSNATDMEMDFDGDSGDNMDMDYDFGSETSEKHRSLNEKGFVPRRIHHSHSKSGSEIDSESDGLHSNGGSRRDSLSTDWIYCAADGEKPKLDDFQLITTLG